MRGRWLSLIGASAALLSFAVMPARASNPTPDATISPTNGYVSWWQDDVGYSCVAGLTIGGNCGFILKVEGTHESSSVHLHSMSGGCGHPFRECTPGSIIVHALSGNPADIDETVGPEHVTFDEHEFNANPIASGTGDVWITATPGLYRITTTPGNDRWAQLVCSTDPTLAC